MTNFQKIIAAALASSASAWRMHNMTIDRSSSDKSVCTERDVNQCAEVPHAPACPSCCVDCNTVLVVEPTIMRPKPDLVLFLHDKESPADTSFGAAGLFSKRAVDSRNTVYLLPQARSNSYGMSYWYSTNSHDINLDCFGDAGPCTRTFDVNEVVNDVSFLVSIIDAAQKEYGEIGSLFVWGEGNGGDMAVDLTCRMGLHLGVQGLIVRRSPGYIEPIGACAYAEAAAHNIFQFATAGEVPKKSVEEFMVTGGASDPEGEIVEEQRRRTKVFLPWVQKMRADEGCLNSPSGSAQFIGARSIISKISRDDTDIYNCARDQSNAVFMSARGDAKRSWNYNSAFLREVFTFLDMAAISEKVAITEDSESAMLYGAKSTYSLGARSDVDENGAFAEFFTDGEKCTEKICGRDRVTRREIINGAEWFIDPVGGRTQEELRAEDANLDATTRSWLRQPPQKRSEGIVSSHTTSNFLRLGQFAKGLVGEVPLDFVEEVSDDLEARQQAKEFAQEDASQSSGMADEVCDGCENPDAFAPGIDVLNQDVTSDADDVEKQMKDGMAGPSLGGLRAMFGFGPSSKPVVGANHVEANPVYDPMDVVLDKELTTPAQYMTEDRIVNFANEEKPQKKLDFFGNPLPEEGVDEDAAQDPAVITHDLLRGGVQVEDVESDPVINDSL